MNSLVALIVSGVSWSRSVVGLVGRPYETYRRIVSHGRSTELLYIALLLACYFGIASIVKVAAFRPFLLTRQFMVLTLGAGINFAVAIGVLWVAGRSIGAVFRLSTLAVSWGYTLLPTVFWFVMTSLLYVIFPPPRTTSEAGIVFSIIFIVISTILLWWKILLSFLVIRFVFRATLPRIAAVYAIALPVLIAESILMYRLGFFKVPFL